MFVRRVSSYTATTYVSINTPHVRASRPSYEFQPTCIPQSVITRYLKCINPSPQLRPLRASTIIIDNIRRDSMHRPFIKHPVPPGARTMRRLGRCQGPLCARAFYHANDDEKRWTPSEGREGGARLERLGISSSRIVYEARRLDTLLNSQIEYPAAFSHP